jgi:hypothetical protein
MDGARTKTRIVPQASSARHPDSPQSPSERYLAGLCRRSFLSLWSFPNTYRDQHRGKEVCDLLVLFPPHVLIFSDKYCEFPDAKTLELSWARWFRRAVQAAAAQSFGAERWLKNHADRVFQDASCERPLPVKLPHPEEMFVHRIVIAHGASAACRRLFGGSGSLMIRSDTDAIEADAALSGETPFTITHSGDVSRFVHVFDDTTADVLLSTLDTIADFVAYLLAKERFLTSRRVIVAGEEELLALYLTSTNQNGKHDFSFPSADSISLAEGFWEGFEKHPDRVAQIHANEVSYVWDGLIEHLAGHHLKGTLESYGSGPPGDVEPSLRFLAREPRTRRRLLSKNLLAVMTSAAEVPYRVRVCEPSNPGDPYYVFLVKRPNAEAGDRNAYREIRRTMLEGYCLVTKLIRPDATDIVGIATEPLGTDDTTEDFLYFDARLWNPDLEARAKAIQAGTGILLNTKLTRNREDEYPLTRQLAAKKGRNRNAPCGCDSGKKYKQCCGRS